jgi:hypothetical protein
MHAIAVVEFGAACVSDRPKAELPAILREIATNVRELAPKAQQVTFS